MTSAAFESITDANADQQASLAEFVGGLKRRKRPIAITFGILMFVTILVTLFWPPTYQSSATILIEEQEIPEDMVRSTITSYATQQIEVIRARVLTLQNIMQFVETYELYDEGELARTPRTEIAEEFIDAVSLELLNAEVIDPRSGRPTEATIAFTLSFEADAPRQSLNVTNELVNLFLNENLRTRTQKTSSTAEFLRKEANVLSEEVQQLESNIALFKAEHQSALPESFQLNMQNLTRYQTQMLAAETRLNELMKRELELESRLASISEYAPVVLPTGESVLSDADRLKALKSEYTTKVARYSENHPDVVRLKREIDALVPIVGSKRDRDEQARILAANQDELQRLREIYSSEHPEVLAQERLVQELSQELLLATDDRSAPAPDNPAYIMLDNQLQSTRLEIASLRGQIAELDTQIQALNEAALKAPAIEREYNDLLRDREVATAKYLDLRVKLKEAELAGELEEGRKGQRFTLVEPPVLPEEPASPNRTALLLLGAVLSIGGGLAIGLLLEAADTTIRSTRQLTDLMGVAPLVTIPYIETPEERAASAPNRRLFIMIGALSGLLIFALILIHNFYRPLDVLWFTVLRKLGIG